MFAFVTVVLPLAGAGVIAACASRHTLVPSLALVFALITLCCAVVAAATGAAFDLPWVPSWGARLTLEADALGSLLALLAAAIGTTIIAYSGPYITHELHERAAPKTEVGRFFAFMLLFLGGMVGVAFARDLILLFLFYDLTAVCSYFLIAFDRSSGTARRAALMTMIVTGIGSIALLAGFLISSAAVGSLDIRELTPTSLPRGVKESTAALIAFAALTKSAQVPFHFWLPRAMAAPTPVSAYLHSAALVAVGVFVLLRLEPFLDDTVAGSMLPYLALLSIAVGSVIALGSDQLKQILAGSTIAQYGYVVFLIGAGGEAGRAAAPLYLLAHAIAKSALFLTVGVISYATGEDRLSRLGGLITRMPLLAMLSAAAAGALAGLPLTIGYFKDEALFEVALGRSVLFSAAAVVAAGLTFAYTARFWIGLFLGNVVGRAPLPHAPTGLILPIAVLAIAAIVGAVVPNVLARLASAAGSSTGMPAHLDLRYALDIPLVLAICGYAIGATIYATRRSWLPRMKGMLRLASRLGPAAVYERALTGLNRLSDRAHHLEVRDLRDRTAAIMVPAGALVAVASIAVFGELRLAVSPFRPDHVPLLIGIAAVAVAAVMALVSRTHLVLVLALSAVGYTLAAVYALLRAPSLALVGVLAETVLTILLLRAFTTLPIGTLREEEVEEGRASTQKRRHRIAGVVAGLIAFIVALSALSAPAGPSVADAHRRLSERIHTPNSVSAILTDFRGLDTAGEATVLGISLLALAMLLAQRNVR